jgi:hypothetical protein
MTAKSVIGLHGKIVDGQNDMDLGKNARAASAVKKLIPRTSFTKCLQGRI